MSHAKCHDALSYRRSRRLFGFFVRGKTPQELAEQYHITVDQVRTILKSHVKVCHVARNKWLAAEARCMALSMELALLRMGLEAEPDQPIETLDPPKQWLELFRRHGVLTVRQLRSIENNALLYKHRFHGNAIQWAILKLDRMGLSHRLVMPALAR